MMNGNSKFNVFLKKVKNKVKKTLKIVNKADLNTNFTLDTSTPSNTILDPLTNKIYTKSEDMSLSELENLYYDVVLKQNFYDGDYGLDWNIAPYQKLAKVLSSTFSPKQHIDIGCGLGLLVKAMRELGVKSYGIDFSEALIDKAEQSTKSFLTVATAEDWIQKASLNDVELVTFTEVFEHLPVSTLEQILTQLHQSYDKKIFLTIPSFGFDATFKLGIQVNEDNPTWRRDMMHNIPFKNIVLENGTPHHGHITLASYRWWTEFFLFHGWSRSRDLEDECFDNFHDTFRLYNWNPYILGKTLAGNDLKNCIKTGISLGTGWHKYYQYEDFAGRWSDGLARVYFWETEFLKRTLRICLSAPEINYIHEWNILITLDNLVRNKEFKFTWKTHFTSAWHEINLREKIVDMNLNLSKQDLKPSDDEIASDCWRITIISPNFCPTEYGNSSDSRRLGIVVHSLELL